MSNQVAFGTCLANVPLITSQYQYPFMLPNTLLALDKVLELTNPLLAFLRDRNLLSLDPL